MRSESVGIALEQKEQTKELNITDLLSSLKDERIKQAGLPPLTFSWDVSYDKKLLVGIYLHGYRMTTSVDNLLFSISPDTWTLNALEDLQHCTPKAITLRLEKLVEILRKRVSGPSFTEKKASMNIEEEKEKENQNINNNLMRIVLD